MLRYVTSALVESEYILLSLHSAQCSQGWACPHGPMTPTPRTAEAD